MALDPYQKERVTELGLALAYALGLALIAAMFDPPRGR